jgi:hypothetical protein
MTQLSSAVERIEARAPGVVLTSSARVDEVGPRSEDRSHRLAPRAPRRSARRRDARGDVCFYVDSQGRQHFNFPQRVWLYPSVPMAVTPGMSIELETLAINLLTPLTRRRDYRAAVGVTSKRVRRLASRFCAECLLTAQSQAWLMQRSTIKAWLASRTRIQGRSRAGAQRIRTQRNRV